MSTPQGHRVVLVVIAVALASACKRAASDVAPIGSASATSTAPPRAIAPAAAQSKPWFSGGFAGNYEAKRTIVEIKTGAVREWGQDDGKQASGSGKLTLHISDEGLVDGSSEGSLGASSASGKLEDDTLRVELSPTDADGLRGVLIASRDGDGFKGSIRASSGDSLRVREASVELKKQAD